MRFQILKIILWPAGSDAAPRELTFEPNMVNVISGASKTGKSAVIPIIDYCLGSEQCAIPVGIIREHCSWFGVVIDTDAGQYLLARKAPGELRYQNAFYIGQGTPVRVPPRIVENKHNRDDVRMLLNRLSGLSKMRLSPDEQEPWSERIGFRDLMAFVFQPQNIVANPDVFFFKADTTVHRERLKNILPYVLGAVTPEVLFARASLVEVDRQLSRVRADLKHIEKTAERWAGDGRGWLQRAIELGLARQEPLPEKWSDILSSLQRVMGAPVPLAPTVSGVTDTLDRAATLRATIRTLNTEAFDLRRRLADVTRLDESAKNHAHAMGVQQERLGLSAWLRQRIGTPNDPLARHAADQTLLGELCDALAATEVQARLRPVTRETLDRETVERKAQLGAVLDRLNMARKELDRIEQSDATARKDAERHTSAMYFLGQLSQAVSQYDEVDRTGPLRAKIAELEQEKRALEKTIDQRAVDARMQDALGRLESLTGKLVPDLDGEWKSSPVRLDPRELTVKVERNEREYFLWEIGSGANWLAYHISMTVALQQFFSTRLNNEVPGLLVYDQPSQVYFPKRATLDDAVDDLDEPDWTIKDVEAVRAVFRLLGKVVSHAKAPLQVIVFDHAGEEVWKGLEGVTVREQWHGRLKLVPVDWLE